MKSEEDEEILIMRSFIMCGLIFARDIVSSIHSRRMSSAWGGNKNAYKRLDG
jgi:hypothetical protein